MTGERVGLSMRDIGEKRFITEVLKPLFNPSDDPRGVGDDCAVVAVPDGMECLVSTDRVPADLIPFVAGLLDYRGLGDYLARLNLSDIAACGGTPVGLLLNMALPAGTALVDAQAICEGFAAAANAAGCAVIGGDMSDAVEMSLSATSIGIVERGLALSRRGARPGDSVFASRPIGLSAVALAYVCRAPSAGTLDRSDEERLWAQFTSMAPMITLGRALVQAGSCTGCMDNTDGLVQSLHELAAASDVAIVLSIDEKDLEGVVLRAAELLATDPLDLALGPGADFSLVGTLKRDAVDTAIADEVRHIGRTEEGEGVWLEVNGSRVRVQPKGWNYYARVTPRAQRGRTMSVDV